MGLRIATSVIQSVSKKFGRIYTLAVEDVNKQIQLIEYPVTCEFSVSRHNMADANTGTFTIYNLNQATRRKIFKDKFDLRTFPSIQFMAGYEGMMPMIYNGQVRKAESYRQGSDFITQIECYDGGSALTTGQGNFTLQSGLSLKGMVGQMISQLPGIKAAAIGDIDGKNTQSKRGTAVSGSLPGIINEVTGNQFYIDMQQAFVLAKNEVIPGEIAEITSANGILGSPRKAENLLELTILFEPRIRISQLININSSAANSNLDYNGAYKVIGLVHQGIISGAVSGECTTKLSLMRPDPGTQIKEVAFAGY
jgi:hypothetical protein